MTKEDQISLMIERGKKRINVQVSLSSAHYNFAGFLPFSKPPGCSVLFEVYHKKEDCRRLKVISQT